MQSIDSELLDFECSISNQMYSNINFKYSLFNNDYHKINEHIKDYALTKRLTYQICPIHKYHSGLKHELLFDDFNWQIFRSKHNELILFVENDGYFNVVVDITEKPDWILKYAIGPQTEPSSKIYNFKKGYVFGLLHEMCEYLQSQLIFKGIYHISLLTSSEMQTKYVEIKTFKQRAVVFKKLGQCEENRLICMHHDSKVIVFQMVFGNIEVDLPYRDWVNHAVYHRNKIDSAIQTKNLITSSCKRIKQKNNKY